MKKMLNENSYYIIFIVLLLVYGFIKNVEVQREKEEYEELIWAVYTVGFHDGYEDALGELEDAIPDVAEGYGDEWLKVNVREAIWDARREIEGREDVYDQHFSAERFYDDWLDEHDDY